ncbi:MAG: decarboxylase, partial [Firmicutes bacterium]|nr:decarboxylase [Bacillota bacterium]
MKRSLLDFLPEHAALDPVSFHMPGHKGSQLYKKLGYGEILDKLMDCDITEIPGADNLFQTEDVILEIMEKYRKLYGSKRSYLLVNGSS